MTLLPIVCSANVENGSDQVEVTGTDASTGLGVLLTDINCRPNATVFLAGVGYLVKARLDTTHFQIERDYEGADASGVSCSIAPFTPEMANRAELATSLRTYSARDALMKARGNGLHYVSLGATGLADPGHGKVSYAGASWATATGLCIDVIDAVGRNRAGLIDRWGLGDTLTVESIATSAYVAYELTQAPTNEGPDAWRKLLDFVVITFDGAIVDQEDVRLVWTPAGSPGPGYEVNAEADDIAGRAAYDAEAEGFKVFVHDDGTGRAAVYRRQGAAGNWVLVAYYTGPQGGQGDKGWSPRLVIVPDGVRYVWQLAGYAGGEGAAPTANVGDYLKGDGTFTATIGDAAPASGPRGSLGGIPLTFDGASTADSDPGPGAVRFNHGTFGSISYIYVDNADVGGAAITAWVDGLDDVVNANARAYLRLANATDPAVYAEFAVVGVITDGTGYRKIPVSPIAGVVPADATLLVATASKSGADGAGTGDVVGPASAVADRVAVFNGTTGKLLKDGGKTIAELVPAGYDDLVITVSLLALQVADNTNVAVFLGSSGNRLADSFDALTYVDVAGATNLYTSTAGVLKPTTTGGFSYANAGGTGDRTASISVTTTSTLNAGDGAASNLVDGANAANLNDGMWINAGQSGREILFDFGSAKAFVEATFRFQSVVAQGSWKWQASNSSGSGFTDQGAAFSLGTATSQVDATTAAATTPYRYWKLLQVSGTTAGVWLNEVEFAIGTGPLVVNNLTVRSATLTAASAPTSMKALLRVKEATSAVAGTDYTLECSRDGGTTWSAMALTELFTSPSPTADIRVVEAAETDVSGQPSGTAPRWRFKTLNNKNVELHDVYLYWS